MKKQTIAALALTAAFALTLIGAPAIAAEIPVVPPGCVWTGGGLACGVGSEQPAPAPEPVVEPVVEAPAEPAPAVEPVVEAPPAPAPVEAEPVAPAPVEAPAPIAPPAPVEPVTEAPADEVDPDLGYTTILETDVTACVDGSQVTTTTEWDAGYLTGDPEWLVEPREDWELVGQSSADTACEVAAPVVPAPAAPTAPVGDVTPIVTEPVSYPTELAATGPDDHLGLVAVWGIAVIAAGLFMFRRRVTN